MGLTVNHVFTSPIADGTNTQIVRPSDWNSSHAVQFSQDVVLGGNTVGISSLAADKLYLQGGDNVTLSGNGQTVIVSAANPGAGGGFSAGVSTGGNTAGQTGTVSNQVVIVGGNNVSLSQATAAGGATVTINGPSLAAYLTTAAQSDHTHSQYVNTSQSSLFQHTSATSAITSNAFPSANTTKFAGTGTTFAGANLSGSITLNSNGLNLSMSAAAGGGGADGYNIIGVNGAGTNSATTIQFNNGNNVTFGLNAGTITASASYPTQTIQPAVAQLNGSSGTMSLAVGSSLSGSTNGSTITFGLASNITTALQSAGAYLTTAAQSNHSHNLATTTTNGSQIVVATTNSAGATFAVPPFITTYAAQTNQTANFYVNGNTTQLSSTAGIDLRSVSFEGAGIASVGVSQGKVLVSVPAGGGGGDGYNIMMMDTNGNSAGATWSSLSGSVYLQGGNNVTLSQNSNTIVVSAAAGGGSPATATMWFPFNEAVNVVGSQGNGTLHIVPVPTPGNIGGDGVVSVDRLALPIIVSASSNSSGSATISHWFGLYQRENTTGSRVTLVHSTSATIGVTYSGSANTTAYSGIRLFTIPWGTSFSDGRYYVANLSRTTSAGTNATIQQVLVSNLNSNFSGLLNVNSNASNQWPLGWGIYSATTSALPSSIAFSQIQGTGSLAMRNPEWFMVNGTA